MLFAYSEDEPCDYFDENEDVTLLLDIVQMLISIYNREPLELFDDE